jgi:hypothetical protein
MVDGRDGDDSLAPQVDPLKVGAREVDNTDSHYFILTPLSKK